MTFIKKTVYVAYVYAYAFLCVGQGTLAALSLEAGSLREPEAHPGHQASFASFPSTGVPGMHGHADCYQWEMWI